MSGMPISKSTAEISFSILVLGWQFGRRAHRIGVVVIFRCERAKSFHTAKEIVRPVGSLVDPDMVSETFPAEMRGQRFVGRRFMPCVHWNKNAVRNVGGCQSNRNNHALQGKSGERPTRPGALRRRIWISPQSCS